MTIMSKIIGAMNHKNQFEREIPNKDGNWLGNQEINQLLD